MTDVRQVEAFLLSREPRGGRARITRVHDGVIELDEIESRLRS